MGVLSLLLSVAKKKWFVGFLLKASPITNTIVSVCGSGCVILNLGEVIVGLLVFLILI